MAGTKARPVSAATTDVLAPLVRRRGRWADVVRRLIANRGALGGCIVGLALVLIAIFAPLLATHDPVATSRDALRPPGRAHLFGTDQIGRDVFSRVVYGARLSLRLGVVAVLISGGVGTIIGLIAGHYRRGVDNVLMRFIDALMSFPGLLLALIIAATLGPGLTNAMIAVGVASIPSYARLVRSSVLQVGAMPYVESARAAGCSDLRLMARHVFPNVTTPIIVLASLGLAGAILAGSALSFLGLGAQPPAPEWGGILSQGRPFFNRAWWIMTYPGIAITIAVMAANLIGDGLRDALDPHQRRS